jgi:hypothetical protein
MNNPNQTQPTATEDLGEASLDLVVGGVVVHEVTEDTSSLRKQEQNDKLGAGGEA